MEAELGSDCGRKGRLVLEGLGEEAPEDLERIQIMSSSFCFGSYKGEAMIRAEGSHFRC